MEDTSKILLFQAMIEQYGVLHVYAEQLMANPCLTILTLMKVAFVPLHCRWYLKDGLVSFLPEGLRNGAAPRRRVETTHRKSAGFRD